MDDTISRQGAIEAWKNDFKGYINALDMPKDDYNGIMEYIDEVPSTQPEDYTELKREFILMASYIDVLLECSDVQKKTLIGFISRLAEFMPWAERD